MKNWKITAMYYGQYTNPRARNSGGLDPELLIEFPFTGFLLQNGEENVLVDTGLSDDSFNGLDMKNWGFVFGRQLVIDALKKENLTPEDIDTVIYTHLHFDHSGNVDLFPNAVTYVQRSEYMSVVHPYDFQVNTPTPEILPWIADRMKKVNRVVLLDGDTRLGNGLELYHIKGHSPGSQAIVVPTEKGRYIITGDTPPDKTELFPWMDEMTLMDGKKISVTPVTDGHLKFLLGEGIHDAYGAYDSYEKLLYLAEKAEPKYFLASHDPGVIYYRYFG